MRAQVTLSSPTSKVSPSTLKKKKLENVPSQGALQLDKNIFTLSHMFSQNSSGTSKKSQEFLRQINPKFEVIKRCRLLSKQTQADFSHLDPFKLISLATKNQVLHLLRTGATIVDLDNKEEVMQFIKEKGFNYNQVDSLEFLAQGGEAKVFRAEIMQPVEVVVKTVLPDIVGQQTMASIMMESHLIKLLDNKDYVVEVFEEIIEFNERQQVVENYMVVVEQARNDLKQIVGFWLEREASLQKGEYFSNEKLFYFLLMTAKALNYLHENNIYFGDLKEANLLVFRDYQIKFGDFGISIKLDEQADMYDERYEIKGGTLGYCLPSIENVLVNGEDRLFSKYELLKNDYFTLRRTFERIKGQLGPGLETMISEGRQQSVNDVYRYGLEEDSLFCQFLNEVKALDPVGNTLSKLIQKYEKQIEEENTDFFQTFLEQLRADERIFAIPNVLKLSRYRSIPQKIQEYFQVQELKQFPFLSPKQKTVIMEDQFYYKNRLDIEINEEDLIASIKSELSHCFNLESAKLFSYLLDYRLCLPDETYCSFYRRVFTPFYTELLKQCLPEEFEGEEGGLVDASKLELMQFKKAIPVNVLESGKVDQEEIMQCFLFYSKTTLNTNQKSLDLLEHILHLSCPSSLPVCKYLPFFFEKAFSIVFHNNLSLNGLLTSTVSSPLFSHRSILERRSYTQLLSLPLVMIFLAAKTSGFDRQALEQYLESQFRKDHLFRKYAHLSGAVVFAKVFEQFNMDERERLQKLKELRGALLNVQSELGNLMSLNAFQISQNSADPNESLKYLRKACNFSIGLQKGSYLINLVLHFKASQQLSEMAASIEQYRHIDYLLYLIVKNYCYGCEQEEEGGLEEVVEEARDLLADQRQYFKIKDVLEQNGNFQKAMGKLLAVEEEMHHASCFYIYHQWYIKQKEDKLFSRLSHSRMSAPSADSLTSLSNLCQIFGQINSGSLYGAIRVEFSDGFVISGHFREGRPQGIVKYCFLDGSELEEEFTQGERTGIYQFRSENAAVFATREKGQVVGQVKITERDGSVYEGEVKFWLKHGQGKQTKREYTMEDKLRVLITEGEWSFGVERRVRKKTWMQEQGTKIREEEYFDEGARHLRTKLYFKNGQVKEDATEKNGKRHGKRIQYNENGQKISEVEYQNGIMHGQVVSYNDSGQPRSIAHYQFGKKHGKFLEFGEEGAIQYQCQYSLGLLHGKELQYFEGGQPRLQREFQNGKEYGHRVSFQQWGGKESEGFVLDGVKQGLFKVYQGDELAALEFYENGECVGRKSKD